MKKLLQLGLLILAGCIRAAAEPVTEAETKSLYHLNIGYEYSLKEDRAHCDENYRKAFALYPQGKGYRVSYGWALYNLKDYAGALDAWHVAFTGIDREYPNRAVCQALAYWRLGKLPAAIEWYQVQCMRDSEYTSLLGMRWQTSAWHSSETQSVENIYQLWRKELDRSDKLRPSVRAKIRSWEDFSRTSAGRAPTKLEFQIQQRLDECFAAELKPAKTIIRPEAVLVLAITVQPSGQIQLGSREMEAAAFAKPLYYSIALKALGAFAEKPVAFPPEQTTPVTFPARFEVELAGAVTGSTGNSN